MRVTPTVKNHHNCKKSSHIGHFLTKILGLIGEAHRLILIGDVFE
jgi:hypothetical protein